MATDCEHCGLNTFESGVALCPLHKAAPDLLAALKVMVGRSIPYTPHWKDDPEIVAAHTAIAKAEAR